MDEQGVASGNQTEEKGLWNVEGRIGNVRGVQECCQSVQGSNEEG